MKSHGRKIVSVNVLNVKNDIIIIVTKSSHLNLGGFRNFCSISLKVGFVS